MPIINECNDAILMPTLILSTLCQWFIFSISLNPFASFGADWFSGTMGTANGPQFHQFLAFRARPIGADSFVFLVDRVDELDDEEQAKCNNQEIDNRLNEFPIIQSDCAGIFR